MMKRNMLLVGLCTWTSLLGAPARAALPSDLAVPVPAGETAVVDLGLYRVGWQSYGKDPVLMPVSWMGHFDATTGISYARWGKVMGREALLMHSPWHVPPGKTWAEYTLSLPQITPIRFSFGIAMGPDMVAPDKSDGVTFSCRLLAEGQERELMRKHQDKAEWLDYSFDLSPYAGKTVVLTLQVEPGPKNNSSFDYSFFGNALIAVGESREAASATMRRLTGTRAAQATLAASRSALSNSGGNGVAPSNLLPCKNSLVQEGASWRFLYVGDDCRVAYVYTPATGTLDDFTARVDDGRTFQPARGGGATVALATNKEALARGGKAVEVRRHDETLEVVWEYENVGQPLRIAWSYQMVRKALVVTARCNEPRVSRFSLGEMVAPLRRTINVPYLEGHLHYLPVENVFACRYLDWTVSQSSMCPQGNAVYERKTDGSRNPLLESGYFAVSPEVDEVLPNIPHPPSPYLSVLGPRIMLDIWGHHQGYAGDAAKLRELKDNGVDHIVIIQHDWQRYGYDVKLPDHLPANPAYGGDEAMIEFGKAANQCGYIWSLHENYIDLYPDAPSYDPAARVLHADGSPSKAWYNAGTKVQSYGLKCSRALGFARQNSPEAHRRYGTTAAYLDVHTCVPPWHQLDHEAGQPMAAMEKAKVKFDSELFQFERDAHGGPLFGEGANHFYWAGRCDGVEAQVVGGEDHVPFLDFDLLKIHPQMVNHGMGYYERWYRRGYDLEYGLNAGSVEQWDKYRAMELAYGHAGFLGHVLVHNVRAVTREHHLMHPVQRLYGTARPAEIQYELEGRFVGAGPALVAGDTSRQRIRYENGLTLWVNWSREPWRVQANPREIGAAPPGTAESTLLPQWGFLALGPDTRVQTSLQDGRVADYVECPEYVFADARTWFDLPYMREAKDIEPRLRAAEYLGDDRLRVTYEWIVKERLDTNYNCFVHAVNQGEDNGDRIVFQGDHALPKPTSQWQPGEVIVDGPHELKVSSRFAQYDLVIGLFRNERVRLKGPSLGGNRIQVARLKVDKQDGRIRNITVDKLSPEEGQAPKRSDQADFTAHTNPNGTWMDFGKVATDGAVKVQREVNRLTLFPYPRSKAVRVSLDVKALAPAARVDQIKVRALQAGTQQDLGACESKMENGRLVLTLEKPDAGRYVISW